MPCSDTLKKSRDVLDLMLPGNDQYNWGTEASAKARECEAVMARWVMLTSPDP
jgi:hypothetical protein